MQRKKWSKLGVCMALFAFMVRSGDVSAQYGGVLSATGIYQQSTAAALRRYRVFPSIVIPNIVGEMIVKELHPLTPIELNTHPIPALVT